MKKILLFLFASSTLNAQSIADTLHNKHLAYVETGIMAATGKDMPFWLRSNQYGIVMPNSNAQATLRGGYYYDHDLDKKGHLDWGFGINAVANIGAVYELNPKSPLAERSRSGKGELLLPEAYARIRYKWFDLFAGRKREIYGLVDTTLSSGSYIWSGNALPMPKIQIGWTDYKPILGKGFISLKGSFAHGWFGEQTFVKNYYLHQKTLYGRIGRPNAKLHLYGGFNHQVQWGGTPKIAISSIQLKGTSYPSTLQAYLFAATGVSLIRLTQRGQIDTTKFSQNDALNRVGNHLGSLDIAGEVDLQNIRLYGYRQQFYDDGKLFKSKKRYDLADALTGLSIYLKGNTILKQINFEYFYSAYQGADRLVENSGYGYNNYFNHGQYPDGWIYNGQTIGTPFIASTPDYKNGYNVWKNRVEYYSINFLLKKGNWNLFSKNTLFYFISPYGMPQTKTQSIYTNLHINRKLNTYTDVSLRVAYDISKINNFGFSVLYKHIIKKSLF